MTAFACDVRFLRFEALCQSHPGVVRFTIDQRSWIGANIGITLGLANRNDGNIERG